MATGARKKLPVNQEETLRRTTAHKRKGLRVSGKGQGWRPTETSPSLVRSMVSQIFGAHSRDFCLCTLQKHLSKYCCQFKKKTFFFVLLCVWILHLIRKYFRSVYLSRLYPEIAHVFFWSDMLDLVLVSLSHRHLFCTVVHLLFTNSSDKMSVFGSPFETGSSVAAWLHQSNLSLSGLVCTRGNELLQVVCVQLSVHLSVSVLFSHTFWHYCSLGIIQVWVCS